MIANFNEMEWREKIVSQARWHLNAWGGVWDPKVDKAGSGNHKIAGKLCADPVSRARQGGVQIAHIFTIAGVSQAPKCLTLSVEAENMYGRSYTPAERNNIDIGSWCGIFALYIYKMSGCSKLPSWDGLKISGVSVEKGTQRKLAREQCHFELTGNPKKGDIGVIGARPVYNKDGSIRIKMGQNHHFIITDVNGSSIKSIDGNAGNLMEIVTGGYTIPKVMETGGFYTPIWENCI